MAKGTSRPTAKRSNSHSGTRKSVYLWEFLFGLLEDDECSSVISWTNKREGIFTLHNPDELAKLWGTVKNRPNMHKYKLFRAMRNYYGKGMLRKVKRKGVYKFLFIPYEAEGCQVAVKPACSSSIPFLDGYQERRIRDNSLPSNDSKRIVADNHNETVSNYEKIIDCRKSTVPIREQTEERFSEFTAYRSRAETFSMSSDSTISLEDLDEPSSQSDISIMEPLNTTENMNFVSNEDSILAKIDNMMLRYLE